MRRGIRRINQGEEEGRKRREGREERRGEGVEDKGENFWSQI